MFYKPATLLPGKTVEDLFRIRYKDPSKVPVSIKITGNRILITAYIRFSEDMLKPYHNRDMEPEPDAETCSAHITRGIKEHWGKDYVIPGIDGRVCVTVDIRTDIPDGQRYVLIRKAKFSNTCYVSSPCIRWGWGIFTTLCPESAMLNWSPTAPGRINMNPWFSEKYYESVAAHEFGHVLGIGDAYGAHYRFFYEAPGTENYMMNNDRSVAPQELLMVLKAHETGRMQYFPYKIVPSLIWSNLKKGAKKKFRRKKHSAKKG